VAESHEIRVLMAPIAGGGLLVPGSVVAEVIDFASPKPYRDAPDWLMGELEWKGWHIPIVNFARLAGTSGDNRVPPRSRILVVRTLTEDSSVLYIGLIIGGLPRFRTVTTGNLEETATTTAEGVFSHVSVEEQAAAIPDLDALARGIEAVTKHA